MNQDLRAPIFCDAWDLSVWLLQKADNAEHNLLARSLAQETLRLLDQITLALKDIDRYHALDAADLTLIRLRLRLRLGIETGLFDESQGQFALELSDNIGRQLGGWQKSLVHAQ